MPTDSPDELLTGSAVAALLAVSSETVRRWAEDGRLPHITLPSGQKRYRRSAVDRILEPDTDEVPA